MLSAYGRGGERAAEPQGRSTTRRPAHRSKVALSGGSQTRVRPGAYATWVAVRLRQGPLLPPPLRVGSSPSVLAVLPSAVARLDRDRSLLPPLCGSGRLRAARASSARSGTEAFSPRALSFFCLIPFASHGCLCCFLPGPPAPRLGPGRGLLRLALRVARLSRRLSGRSPARGRGRVRGVRAGAGCGRACRRPVGVGPLGRVLWRGRWRRAGGLRSPLGRARPRRGRSGAGGCVSAAVGVLPRLRLPAGAGPVPVAVAVLLGAGLGLVGLARFRRRARPAVPRVPPARRPGSAPCGASPPSAAAGSSGPSRRRSSPPLERFGCGQLYGLFGP